MSEDNGPRLDTSLVRAIQDLNGHPERLSVATDTSTWTTVWRTIVRTGRPDPMSNPSADVDVASGDITGLVRELISGPVSTPTGTWIVQTNALIGPDYLLISSDGTYARPPSRDQYWRPSSAATDAARFEPVEQINAYTDDDWSRRLQGLE